MSGIVGIYDRSGAPVDRGAVAGARSFSFLSRAGRARYLVATARSAWATPLLRTTRESLNERQPANLDGKLWITADARIDCREELEKKLALEGHGAAGRAATDSDLILRA